MSDRSGRRKFQLVLIKPSHYDDDGYVIQWVKSWIPSNSLACLYGLCQDLVERDAFPEVEIALEAFDETNYVVPYQKLIRRFARNDNFGLVCFVGVQTNQFPRTLDVARRLRAAGIQVVAGGFHIAGCLAMLNQLPPELQEARDLGVSFYAGEAEGRMAEVIGDAIAGQLKPEYNYLADLPGMQDQVVPFVPAALAERYDKGFSSFDLGRGCPFQCSFCTIINVQGRKSRFRSADDLERIVRQNHAQGVSRFFITDDNFARNKNWEALFDRLIELRENEGIGIHFLIQVDTLCHKIPGFVEKAARAGCNSVFVGLESVDPENLLAANKRQNKITDYRRMFQMWQELGVMTYAGYILGFPADTRESVLRAIGILKRELPVDAIEFTMLTPLPGSADHKHMLEAGVAMDPDMNIYDLEHATTEHPSMSRAELQALYREAWFTYYSDDHVATLMKRTRGYGFKPVRRWQLAIQVFGAYRFEKVHPLQAGFFRRKIRTERRPSLGIEPALIFYPKRVWQTLSTYLPWAWYAWRLHRVRKAIERDDANKSYRDFAMTPVEDDEFEELEMFQISDAARKQVARAQANALARDSREARTAAGD